MPCQPHPNLMLVPEAGGSSAGYPQDASDGLQRRSDANANVWAWNPLFGEWQRMHSIVWGDTLWNLSATYYGSPSLPGVHAIHHVDQNYAIQGPSADTGLIPGDVILIPGLAQVFDAPAGPAPVPPPVIVEPPTPAPPPVVIAPPTIPVPGAPGAVTPEPFPVIPPVNGGPGVPVVLQPAPPAPMTEDERKRRNMLIAGALVIGALAVGGIVYSRSKRRNPRRRRRAA